VSRITKSKRLIEMLFALDVLYTRGIPFQFSIIGAPIFEHDKAYEKEIQREIARRPYASDVHFIGMVPYRELPNALGRGSVFINLSKTGSIDRAVLEAMSIGLAPVTSNEAFREMLTPFGLYVKEDSPKCIADTLVHAKNVDRAELSRYVREYHSLQRLIPAMFDIMRAP
jgi:glycosyltransferase involved in cell wall biosynthesis